MALSGTQTTLDVGAAGGIRESLEDVIFDLFPMDTYLLTNLESTTAENTFHEWMTDALAGATVNRQVEGDDAVHLNISGVHIGAYGPLTPKAIALLKFAAAWRPSSNP